MNHYDQVEVLLVEDTPEDAELVVRTLKKHRLANQMEWVKDGAEALDFVFARGAYAERSMRYAPKVILLDLKLPKVDGLEVLQAIRADPRTRPIPVVIMTSSTQDEDVKRGYQCGANSFVSKPVKFEDFAEVASKLGMYWLLINRAPEPASGDSPIAVPGVS